MAKPDKPNTIPHAFRPLLENKEMVFQMFDKFPLPIEAFSPDGISVFVNSAFLELYTIANANLVLGKHNIFDDALGKGNKDLRNVLKRAFNGEALTFTFHPPAGNFVKAGIIKEKPFEAALMDTHFVPVHNGSELVLVICIYEVITLYKDGGKL
jgi:hypothetical protein